MIALAHSRGSHRFDWIHRKRDGKEFPVEVTMKPIELDGKRVLLVVWHDLSERVEAEQTLRKSEQQFRTLFDLTDTALVQVDNKGNFRQINKKLTEVLGYTHEDIPTLDQWWPKAYPDPEYRQWVIENWSAAVQSAAETSSDIKSDEYLVTCKNGEIRRMFISGRIMEGSLLATLVDATELKQAEEAMRQAKEMAEEATRAKSDFLDNMSHEIRTPMNAIIGLSHLALGNATDRKQRDYLEKIHASGQNLLGIINDILDFSKIEAGKLDMELADFDLEEVLDSLANVVNVTAAEKGLERAEPRYPLVLMDWKLPDMDGIQVTRRILESPRISPPPQIVMVSAYGREEVMAQAEAADIKAYLIKPVSPSSLLDTILETMGHGVARTESTPGVLPAREQLRGARVLLVEDNEINRQVALELLTQAGIEVVTANNGLEGLETLAAQPGEIDAVLMDIQMPVMDGQSATRKIREDDRFHDLPVIAMTANAMAGDRERALEAGLNDHVAKPIDVAELFDVLGRWIRLPDHRLSQAAGPADRVRERAPELTEIPGLDYDSGLARCGGNLGLYRKILGTFCETQAAAPGRIRADLDAGDHHAAEREAHTLKGVAGNIGADAVQAAAKTVETQIKQENDTDTGLAALETPLRALIESLSQALVSTEPSYRCDTPSPAPELPALLDQLQALLHDNDTEAGDLAEKIYSQLADDETRSRLQPICSLIEDFEFEDAVELLAKFRAALE